MHHHQLSREMTKEDQQLTAQILDEPACTMQCELWVARVRTNGSARTFELKTCFFTIDNKIMETAPMKLQYARKLKNLYTKLCKYKAETNLNDAVIIRIAAIASNSPCCMQKSIKSQS
jgi:hypothetical protein